MTITLGPFRLEHQIGEGGMGEVWRAVHVRESVPVAIKVVKSRRARSARFIASFEAEVRAVASLDHPGIAAVYDHGTISEQVQAATNGRFVAGSPYLAMELAAHGALSDTALPLSWPHLRSVLLSVLDALSHAHARGLIHRDLKVANILCCRGRDDVLRFKLTDFGIAHSLHHDTREGMLEHSISGTPRFMAPEQFTGHWRDYGPWTDLYALGCMAYELATGRVPFEGSSMVALFQRHTEEPFPSLTDDGRRFPSGLDGWLKRLSAKAPEHRFQLAADAAWALHQVAEGFEVDEDAAACQSRPRTATSTSGTNLSNQTTNVFDNAARPAEALALASTIEASVLTRSLPALDSSWFEGPPDISEASKGSSSLPPMPVDWHRSAASARTHRLGGVGLGLYGLRPIPLTNRVEERDRLWTSLAEVRTSGMPRACVLRGASGFGKSRLAQWLGERAHEVGAATVCKVGHAPAPGSTTGLGPMVARHLQCLGLTRFEVRARVLQHLARYGANSDLDVRALTSLLPHLDTEAHDDIGDVTFHTPRERWAVLHRFLERVSMERPVIVWVDDAQWGADSLEFVDYVLTRSLEPGVLRALFILTVGEEALAKRPYEAELLDVISARETVETVPVGPLPEADHSELVTSLLGLDDELASQVRERTAGNPLFAIQLVGDWVARGILCAENDGFRLQQGATAELPDDLYAVWSERITRLLSGRPGSASIVLELAAALGQEVNLKEWADVVAAVATASTGPVVIDPTMITHLLDERLATLEGGYLAFAQGMFRETIERRAREASRWARHNRTCADVLAQRYRPGTPRRAARLGLHRLAAGQSVAAADLLLEGAAESEERGEHPNALYLLDRCDEALSHLDAPDEDWRSGAASVLRAGVISTHRQDQALELARRAERRADEMGWKKVRADALECLGRIARKRIELDEALSLYDRARADYVDLGDARGQARAIQGLGHTRMSMGDLPGATVDTHRALGLFEGLHYDRGAAWCLNTLGDLARKQGDLDAAREAYDRSRDIFERIGHTTGALWCVHDLAQIDRDRGELDAAEEGYRRTIALARAAGNEMMAPRFNLGLTQLARAGAGGLSQARETFEDILADAVRLGQIGHANIAHGCLLPCAADAGDWTACDRHLHHAQQLLAGAAYTDADVADCIERAANIAAAAGERSLARQAFELAIEQWQALGDEARLKAAQQALDLV